LVSEGVFIAGRGVLSAAGAGLAASAEALICGAPRFAILESWGPVARLDEAGERSLATLLAQKPWRGVDRAVGLGVLAARQAWNDARKSCDPADTAVIVASSRGATGLLEDAHARFLEHGKVPTTTSPATTAGAFAAAVARDLHCGALSLSVSSACSGGLNAIGLASTLVASGQAASAIAGGAESSLTPFTLAQLRAVGVLAKSPSILYPCRPMQAARCGLVPGEGAAAVVLAAKAPAGGAFARVLGFGSATEQATATGISTDGLAVHLAARRALAAAGMGPGDVSLVVAHGASTQKGDAAEWAAYERLFEGRVPPLAFHKWLTGHLLGASGAFAVALASEHLRTGLLPDAPYWNEGALAPRPPARLTKAETALVIAMGFGGSASALILSRA